MTHSFIHLTLRPFCVHSLVTMLKKIMSGVLFIIIANSIIFMAVGLFQMETVISYQFFSFKSFRNELAEDFASVLWCQVQIFKKLPI